MRLLAEARRARETRAAWALILNHPGHDQKTHGRKGSGTPADLHDNEETIRAVYNYHDERTGLTATVEGIRSGGPEFSTYVDISVTDRDGNVVGGGTRTIRPADQKSVSHSGFGLEPGFQGQGFMARYNAQTEEAYREHGIETVRINANVDVGGYAWSRAGYDFSNGRGNVESRADDYARRNPSVRAEIDRVARNPNSTPADFAMIGHTPGATVWPGKEIMLDSSWDGVKKL